MPLTTWNCVFSKKKKRRIIFEKISLFSKKLLSEQNSQVATLCYLHFLTGGKWDFEVANLLLPTVNFEPCHGSKCRINRD